MTRSCLLHPQSIAVVGTDTKRVKYGFKRFLDETYTTLFLLSVWSCGEEKRENTTFRLPKLCFCPSVCSLCGQFMLGYQSTEKLEHFLYLYYEKGILLYSPNENKKHKHTLPARSCLNCFHRFKTMALYYYIK